MGGQYRQNEWVDLEECADNGGGYNIGWVREGEWLEYTVDVESPYVYHFSARVSSLENGGDFTFKVLSDESEVFSEQIIFGPTGGWQNWETIPIGDAALQQGMHILRFETSSEDYNINYFEAESTAPIVVSNSWFLH
jgi:hypothetical protein